MLFELLQADIRRPTTSTLDEFFETNLTLFDVKGSILFDADFLDRMKMTSTK